MPKKNYLCISTTHHKDKIMKKKVLSLLAFLPAFTTVMAQQTAEVPDRDEILSMQ
jgi:hypothetical protein